MLAQVAWLNRQLFGRKSEKLAHLDPNQLSLFDPPAVSYTHLYERKNDYREVEQQR